MDPSPLLHPGPTPFSAPPMSRRRVFRLLASLVALLAARAVRAQTAVTVQLDAERQLIDGFGASSAWTAQNITDAQADLFFSQTTGLGLSLLRVRIAPSGNSWETATAQKAVARGARVWATPWSPPGAWKTNGTDNNGGSLLPDYRDDWAARLAQFVVNMQAVGVPILALSAQNEPNWTAEWETCRWTPAELAAFVRDHLGPALVARGVPTRVLAPESIDWYSIDDYADPLLGDAAARVFVSHVATHSYGGAAFAYAAPAAAGLPFWQTEYSDGAAASDPTIDSALRVAGVIHDFLTVAQGNAWHYWWMYPSSTNASSTGALVEAGAMTKRGWGLANWARFVRPGHRRVLTTGSTSTLRVTAFTSSADRRLAIVLVNSSTSARTVTLTFTGGPAAATLIPWETSATRSLEALPALSADGNGAFSVTLPARSITTLAGVTSTPPPAPTLSLTTSLVTENSPAGTPIGRPVVGNVAAGIEFTFAFATGAGDADNALFAFAGGFLRTTGPLDHEAAATRSVRLRATGGDGTVVEGSLLVTVVNRTDEYADWSAGLPVGARSATDDGDGDGVANLLAYALGFATGSGAPAGALPALAQDGGGAWRFGFALPASAPADIRYAIERSTDLGTWQELAAKTGPAAWSGSAAVLVEPAGTGRSRASIADDTSSERRFYRLRVKLPD